MREEKIQTEGRPAFEACGSREKDFLIRAAKEYKTPGYVFDTDRFLARARFFQQILGDRIRVNFCMKANPFLTETSLSFTDRIEVCSFGEYLLTKASGIPAEKLLISGVLKKEEDIGIMVRDCRDRSLYTAESRGQLEGLERAAEKNDVTLSVYLRLTSGNQFGMDEVTILSILANFASYKRLRFYGLHFFSGTQKHKIRIHEKEIHALDRLIHRIEEETGCKVSHLEYGTGFGVPYFTDQKEDATSKEFLEEFAGLLKNMDYQGQISLEMGRALAFDCGYYLTTIREIKTNGERTYVITDGGIHQLNYDGQLRGIYTPEMDRIREDGIEAIDPDGGHSYTVCGSLCTVNDILVSKLLSQDLRPGDILVFERVGAYSFYEGMQLFLSHELPAVLLYQRERGFALARKRMESFRLNMACEGDRPFSNME
ncbi:MAG: diaminopimelate decarboxylase [Lachnospiraceae bacterium]|nr:diaminopimelate decarboxylase [Lachnospiraceae bacterium]